MKQEIIPVGCVLPICAESTCFNSHQMSALVGGGGGVVAISVRMTLSPK